MLDTDSNSEGAVMTMSKVARNAGSSKDGKTARAWVGLELGREHPAGAVATWGAVRNAKQPLTPRYDLPAIVDL